MSRTFPRALGCGVWLAAIAGCGSRGTGPASVDGTYALQTLNEAALPYDHQGLGCCTYLSGELRLGQGRYAVSGADRGLSRGARAGEGEPAREAVRGAGLPIPDDSPLEVS